MNSHQKITQFCQKHQQPKLQICGRQTCLNLYCFQCFTQHRVKYSLSGQNHNISVTFSDKSKQFLIRWNRYLIPKLEDMISVLKFKGTYKNIFYIFTKDNKSSQTGQTLQCFDENVLRQVSTTELTRICIEVMQSHMNLIIENVKCLSNVTNINDLNNRQFLRDLFFLFVEDAQKNLKMILRIIEERISQRFGVIDIYKNLGIRFQAQQAQEMEKARKQILKQYEQKGNQIGLMNNHVKINTLMKLSHSQFISESPSENKNHDKNQMLRSVMTPVSPQKQSSSGHGRHNSSFSHRVPVFSPAEQMKGQQLYQSSSSKKLEQKLQQILNFTSSMIKAQSQSHKEDSDCNSVHCKSIQGTQLNNSNYPTMTMNSATTTLRQENQQFSLRFEHIQSRMKQQISSLQKMLKQEKQRRLRCEDELSMVNQDNMYLKIRLKQKDQLIQSLTLQREKYLNQSQILQLKLENLSANDRQNKTIQQFSICKNGYKNVRGMTPTETHKDFMPFDLNSKIRILSPRIRESIPSKSFRAYESGKEIRNQQQVQQQQIHKLKIQIEGYSRSLKSIQLSKLSLEQQLQRISQKLRSKEQEGQEMMKRMQQKHQEQLQSQRIDFEKALGDHQNQIYQIKNKYQKYIQDENQAMFQMKSNFEREKQQRDQIINRVNIEYSQILQKLFQCQHRVKGYQQQLRQARQRQESVKCNQQAILQNYLQSLQQLDSIAQKLRIKQQDCLRFQQSNQILRKNLEIIQSKQTRQAQSCSIRQNGQVYELIQDQKKIFRDMESKISQQADFIISREGFQSDQQQLDCIKHSVSLAQQQAEASLDQAKKINMQLAVQNSILKRDMEDLQKCLKKLQSELRTSRNTELTNINIDEELLTDIIVLESEVAAQKHNVQKMMQFMLNYADQIGVKPKDMLDKLKAFRQKQKRTTFQQNKTQINAVNINLK